MASNSLTLAKVANTLAMHHFLMDEDACGLEATAEPSQGFPSTDYSAKWQLGKS